MTTDQIMRLLAPRAWARTVLACSNVPEGTREIAQQLTRPRESATPEEVDMAYHQLKTSGRLQQQEIDRAHAAEVAAGLH